jgi:drug/metabolite transporter (DMT)-like permease
LIVAVVSILVLNETMTPMKIFAVLTIGGSVCLMALVRGAVSRIPPKAFIFAVLAAGSTASYTLLDGIGARLSGSVAGFIILLSILDGISTSGYVLARRGLSAFVGLLPLWRSGLCAAIMSLGSYWIAIWAFTKAPIALVAALRETSVLFAFVIGILVLKEKAGRTESLRLSSSRRASS